ncbi:MAG: D-alanyl-D-alanine carboxypeptidase/D-alanyl-D-alanine-endopeptidase [Ignavibacteriae bacterium]|nr:MAG: D-alanyl-D-alanine carboxypeptidase/D-alanyl-D-alanine-endopeptidase [Ignavibacteriota bacterium]
MILSWLFKHKPALPSGRVELKFYIFLIPLFLFNTSLFSQSSVKQLEAGINKIIDDPFFESSVISIDIFNLTDNLPLYKKNNRLLLHPASNMKILTSLAGLLFLGSGYQFETKMLHTGIISGDTLYGDIYVVGGFDPDFTTDDLEKFVNELENSGIKYIAGNLYTDLSAKDSLYWGKGWMWDDEPDPNAPYLSALNINDNSIEVFISGTEIDSLPSVKLIPETEYVQVENLAVTVAASNKNNFNITRSWVERENKIIIDGEVRSGKVIDKDRNTEKLSLPEPGKYFLTLLKEQLQRRGIIFKGLIDKKTLPENSTHLSSVYRSLDTVLVNMNKESDNLSAEMLLYALALNDSGAPASAENGIEAIRRMIELTGLDEENYSLADGSGVSRYNLISTELIINIFKYFYNSKPYIFKTFYNTLSTAGIDGTLEKRMRNTLGEGNLKAKTGTLNGVATLSGFVNAANGDLIAFSIFIQNYTTKNLTARKFIDRICELLAGFK